MKLACVSCSGNCSGCSSLRMHGGMNGLGQWEEIIGIGAGMLARSNGGAPSAGGPGAASFSNEVKTQVTTQVSPQISPVFVQQDSPSNSPVNASPSQVAPFYKPEPLNAPATGAIPGFDNSSGYAPTGVPSALGRTEVSTPLLALAGLALVAALALSVKKRRAKT